MFSDSDTSFDTSDIISSSTTSRIKTRRELYTELIGTVLRNFRQGIRSAVNLSQLRLQNLNELRQRRQYDFANSNSYSNNYNGNNDNKREMTEAPNKILIGRNDYVEDNNNKIRMLQRLSEATTSSSGSSSSNSTMNTNNNLINTTSTHIILPSEIKLIDSTKENQKNETTTADEENSFGLKLNGDEMDNNDGYNYNGQNNNNNQNKFGTAPDDDDNFGGSDATTGDKDDGYNQGVGTYDNNSNNINKDIIVSSILTALGIIPPQGGANDSNTIDKTQLEPGATLRNIRNFIIQRKVKKLAQFVITPFLESLSRAQLNATQDNGNGNKDKTNTTPDDYDRDFEETISNPELSAFTSSSARNLDSYGIMVLEFFGTIFGLTWGIASQIQGMVMPET